MTSIVLLFLERSLSPKIILGFEQVSCENVMLDRLTPYWRLHPVLRQNCVVYGLTDLWTQIRLHRICTEK